MTQPPMNPDPQYGQQPQYGQPGMMAPPPAPEKKKSWFARHKILTGIGIAVVAIVLISAIAGGGNRADNTNAAQPQATTANNAAEAPAEEAGQDEPAQEAPAEAAGAGIGTSVLSGDLQFTVTSVEAGIPRVGNEYIGSDAQGQYYFVHVEVLNTGNEAVAFSSSGQKLIDDQGREHESDASASLYMENNDVLFTKINPGNTVVGTIVFDIPADANPVKVLLSGGFLKSDAEISLS